jgi:Rad3-related DNA helicase
VATTARTVASLHLRAAGPVAVFFPSYAYAESVAREFEGASLQPKRADLSTQSAWINGAVAEGRALFLVLGSGFAEGIDLLGGRVSHAMVVGPALPEVNPVQRARLAALAHLGRDAAFDRVYRIPGMQKVNQALGRLVRAPGQSARVLLHCRRFAEPGYERLLAPEYRSGRRILEDDDLSAWLASPR